jgi:phage/plasmid primase-like uncharacterized protein
MGYSIGDIKSRARGHWSQILLELTPNFSEAIEKVGKHVPCPMHGGNNGFRLFPDFHETGGGTCNTCGHFPNGIKLISEAKKCSEEEAIKSVATFLNSNGKSLSHKNPESIDTKKEKIENTAKPSWVQKIIREAQPDSGRVSEYFKSRGLSGSVPNGILFHPKVPYFEDGREVEYFPAMVALINKGNQNLGLLLTYLAKKGVGKAPVSNPKKTCKINPDKTLSGGAIWLKLPAEGKPIILCEGIETGLACLQATGYSVVACGNTSLLMSVSLPKEYSQLFIAADNDKNNAGLNAAETLANRLFQEGQEVFLRMPPDIHVNGQSSVDWLDIFNEKGEIFVKEQFKISDPWNPQKSTTFLPSEANAGSGAVTFDTISEYSGLALLSESSTPDEIAETVKRFVSSTKNIDSISIGFFKSELIQKLKSIRVQGASDIVKQTYAQLMANEDTQTQGTALLFEEVEPWGGEVNGLELANEIRAFVEKHSVLPEKADIAVTLWVFFSWAHDAFSISPILHFSSPAKRCGKTSVLKILKRLVNKPLMMANISTAALFRSVDYCKPTLLVDEVDTFLKFNVEIHGILNAGHERDSAFVLRVEGENRDVKKFNVWAPKVLAGIGRRKETLEDRTISISMKRKSSNENFSKLNIGSNDSCLIIRRKLLRWVNDHFQNLQRAAPDLPDGLHDRAEDNWIPLISISEEIGGGWPEDAHKAAMTISGLKVNEDEDLGIQLLKDIQQVFKKSKNPKTLFSTVILIALTKLEESPWSKFDRNGAPLDPRGLGKLLKPFGINSKSVRADPINKVKKLKGYHLADFEDSFSRYLAEPESLPRISSHKAKIKRGKRGIIEK